MAPGQQPCGVAPRVAGGSRCLIPRRSDGMYNKLVERASTSVNRVQRCSPVVQMQQQAAAKKSVASAGSHTHTLERDQ